MPTIGVSFCQEKNAHSTCESAHHTLFIGVRCTLAVKKWVNSSQTSLRSEGSPFPITSVSAERRFPRFPWLISTTECTEPPIGVTEAATNFASRHHSRHWLAHNSPCAVLAPSDTGSYFPHHWLINPPSLAHNSPVAGSKIPPKEDGDTVAPWGNPKSGP